MEKERERERMKRKEEFAGNFIAGCVLVLKAFRCFVVVVVVMLQMLRG